MKKLLPLLLFICPFSLFTCFAQDRHIVDSLQNEIKKFEAHKKELGSNATPLMDSVKADLLYGIALEYWGGGLDTALYYANQILKLSEQIGYKKGLSNSYNLMGLTYMQRRDFPAALDNYQKALKIRTEIGYKKGMEGIYNNLGLLYGNQNLYNEAIKWELKVVQINEEIGNKEGMSAAYGRMARIYNGLGNYTEALKNCLSALKIGEELGDKSIIGGANIEIGNMYYELGNYPEALKYSLNGLQIEEEIGENYRIAYAYGNIGRICYKQGNDTGAIRNLLACLKIHERLPNGNAGITFSKYNLGLVYLDMGNYPEALKYSLGALKSYQEMGFKNTQAMAHIEIGSIFEKQGKFHEALDSTAKGLMLAKQIDAKVEMKDAYYRLAAINTDLQDYKTASYDYKEYIIYLDSVSSNEVQQKISVMEMNYAFNKREDSIRLEQEKSNVIKAAESKRKSIVTGSAVVISILILLLAILVIRSQQVRRKKDKMIFEKETYLLQLEKQKMEDELTKAKLALDEYIKNMVEKNELLEQFKLDVENLKNLKAKEIDENRVENLEHLNKTTILTEQDWNKFKKLFEQVHKGFFIRLKEKLPELTQAETRLLCLTKLKLDPKEMGGILGVSFDTVYKSRYRLRKKLGLSEENSIEYVVNTI